MENLRLPVTLHVISVSFLNRSVLNTADKLLGMCPKVMLLPFTTVTGCGSKTF